MDAGYGTFQQLSKEEAKIKLENDMTKGKVFCVGEIVKVKESKFRVKSIKPTELRLKLLPTMED